MPKSKRETSQSKSQAEILQQEIDKNIGRIDSILNIVKKDQALLKGIKLPEKKEAEKMKSLEFEEDTFRINSTGWKIEDRKVHDQEIPIKVKVHPRGDVIEYLTGPAKGEQIFITYDAFIREVCKAKGCTREEAEKKYLMNSEELKEKMIDKPAHSQEYKDFFDTEIKGHLAGFGDPNYGKYDSIGIRSYVWLAGGAGVGFYQDKWAQGSDSNRYGFSGRLLKNN